MICIGIDPGFTGGLAVIPSEGPPEVYDLPTMLVEGATKDHTEYDLAALQARLVDVRRRADVEFLRVAIEFVRGIPKRPGLAGKQGASSIWLQGHGVGVIEGVVAGIGLSRQRVSPQTWRKAIGVPGGENAKEASRYAALQLFPGLGDQLKRKKDHGRAEALLIAEYLRRTAGR